MNTTLVSVESGGIRVVPSLANMLTCIRLGGRASGKGQAFMFPATPEYARLLRSALRVIQTTPEFDALIFGTEPAQSRGHGGSTSVSTPTPALVRVSEPEIVLPAGLLTTPWRHQIAAYKFCLDRFAAGMHGILLAMGMGCVEGDAELIINRRGNARRMTLRELHRKFHGGHTAGRCWRNFPTCTRSMVDGELLLNDVIDVIAQGVKPVVRVRLASGKSLRVTSDHELARPDGTWTEAGKLAPEDLVLTEGIPVRLDGPEVRFVPKPDAVISVEADGETDVYDLRMAGPGHNFVANGIIVHNCGKSLVACMLLLELHESRAKDKKPPCVMVVCPRRVIQVWTEQFAKHVGMDMVVVALDDQAGSVAQKTALAEEKLKLAVILGRPFVCVINYDGSWRDPWASWAEKHYWDFIIADEAHRLKTPSGKASLEFKRLRPHARYRVALTGTPMPHGPMDIYAIFRFLDVTIFGPSFSTFRAKYAVMGGYQRKQITGYRNLEELERHMSRITFRVGPEVLDLPPATEVTYYCALTGEAARIYKDLDEDFVARVKSGTVTAANAMVKILRLQQVTGGCVPNDDGEAQRIDSSKLTLLADTLEDIGPDEPVVVFCRFHADLDAVHEACKSNGYTGMELSGRRDQLKRWNDGEAQVLAVQIESGGEGVDLTRARYSIFYSIGWRLEKYEQAKKRTHRPGQEKPVTHIHLVARTTVDEKVLRALEKRADIVESILAEIKH